MKYAIDKIENGIALLENIKDGSKVELSIEELPSAIKEGMILNYENNRYSIDLVEEQKRRDSIKSKFNRLRKK